jgi:putative membrane protein
MNYIRTTFLSVLVIFMNLSSQVVAASDKLDDATIIAIFDQANAVDIYNGRMGVKYGVSAEVRNLGAMVVTDHVAVQQMGRELAKKLDIIPTPPDNDSSVADHAKTVALLQSKTGSEFDKAYLRHEIAFHQSVVDAIKGTLLPAIHNKELKELVNNVLPGFEHHLAETKAVAKKMKIAQ